MKELSLSSWNPPPGYRKLAGKKFFSLLIHGDGSSFGNSVVVTILLQQGCCQSCSDKLGTDPIFPSSCFKPVDNLGRATRIETADSLFTDLRLLVK